MRALLFWVWLVGCAAPAVGAVEPTSGGEATPVSELLPEYTDGAVDVQRWDGHIAVAWGGRVYGSSGEDVTTNVTVALAALALSRTPIPEARVAVLGLGTGVETGMFLDARVGRVDLFDHEPSVRRAAAYLAEHSHLRFVEGEPRADAMTLIERPEQIDPGARYDAIVHTPSLSVMSEPSRLFTLERFRALRARLAPGGVVVIHLQMYEIRPFLFGSLLRTFARAFPHAVLFTGSPLSSDGVLVGANEPIALDLARADGLFLAPITRLWLERGEIERPTDLAAQMIFATPEEMLAYAGVGPVYDAAHPLAATELPRRPPWPEVPNSETAIWSRWEESVRAFQTEYDNDFIDPFYASAWRYGHACNFLAPVECRFFRGPLDAARLAQLAVSYASRALREPATFLRARALELEPSSVAAQRAERVVVRLLAASDDPRLAARMRALVAADAILPFASTLDATWGSGETFTGAVQEALTTYGPSLAPDSRARLMLLLVYARHSEGADAAGREALDALLAGNHDVLDRHPDAWYLAARIDYAGRPTRATHAMERYVDLVGDLGGPP